MASRHPPHRAFSVVELLVIVLILALGTAFLMPTLCRSSEQANRARCAKTLRALGSMLQMYANENRGAFPRTAADESDWPVPVFFTNANSRRSFGPDAPAPNDVTAAMFLLMRTQDLPGDVFICPSSTGEQTRQNPANAANFADPVQLTYSYINPYPSKAAVDAGFKLAFQTTSDFAIAADINPGGSALLTVKPDGRRREMVNVNSPNHGGDGQNVLYLDGRVEFHNTPFCGMKRPVGDRDNIYTAGAPGGSRPQTVVGAAVDQFDSVLLPTSQSGPATASMSTQRVFGVREIVWLWTAIVVAVAAVTSIGIVLVKQRRSARARPTT